MEQGCQDHHLCCFGIEERQRHNTDEAARTATGYFSKYITGINYGRNMQSVTERMLWSYACPSDLNDVEHRKTFCENLYDVAGNHVTNPPRVCGGTGPDILNFSPVIAALNQSQEEADALKKQYEEDSQATVKRVMQITAIVVVLIIILFLIWNFL